jgi:hypothetical protein
VIGEDAAARAALNDHATGTWVAVAWADLSSPSFFTQQPGNLLLFATVCASSKQRVVRRELTKSLSSDIVPNQQEILATPAQKKKKKKKKKSTPVLPLFHEATHSPVNPENTSQNILTNLSSTQLPGKELLYRSLWIMYPDPWNKERLMMVKNAASKNVWYTVLMTCFLMVISHAGEKETVFFTT